MSRIFCVVDIPTLAVTDALRQHLKSHDEFSNTPLYATLTYRCKQVHSLIVHEHTDTGNGRQSTGNRKRHRKRKSTPCRATNMYRTTPLMLLLMLAAQLLMTRAQVFGVPKKDEVKKRLLQHQADLQAQIAAGTSSHEISGNGDQHQAIPDFLTPQDAADMEEIILKASADTDTTAMIAKMKSEMMEAIEALGQEPSADILRGMKMALDEMRMLDYLFKDPERALKEMRKDGMIDKKKYKQYKKDPQLLEIDTRKGLYFSFVSLAVAGGYL